MPSTREIVDAAQKLHGYLVEHHWRPPVVSGPDPGIRWNARVGRFVKSYSPFIPWRDDLVYAQAQKYWIHGNLLLADLGLDAGLSDEGGDMASQTARYLADAQTPEGYWPYPNPEWSGRIATVEGNYAAMGLLLMYERNRDAHLLDAAQRWYDYVVSGIGFQLRGRTLAVNYFGNVAGGRIPNNSASAVRTNAMLFQATGDDSYLEYCGPMMDFMAQAQLESGELPYSVVGVTGGGRVHFLCYQYNAFQFLNILDYWRRTGDGAAEEVLGRLASYLSNGLTAAGAARYDCSSDTPEVVYYGAAVATALREATIEGMGDFGPLADRGFDRVVSHQRDDGGFPYSFGTYGFADDTRSYPRYLSMILTHLLTELSIRRAHDGAGRS